MEKESKVPEDNHARELLLIKEEIAKMKKTYSLPNATRFGYDDLCIHPDLNLPEGFKTPKFEIFNSTGNPTAHLRGYCDQTLGAGRN